MIGQGSSPVGRNWVAQADGDDAPSSAAWDALARAPGRSSPGRGARRLPRSRYGPARPLPALALVRRHTLGHHEARGPSVSTGSTKVERVCWPSKVEVEPTDNAQRTVRPRRRSRQELQQRFNEKLGRCGVPELFHEVKGVFKTDWPRARKWSNTYGLAFKLQRPTPSGRYSAQYARVDPNQDELATVFFPRAIRLCKDEFTPRVEEVPYRTCPPDREALPADEDEQPEIQFQLAPNVWNDHEASLTELGQAVYEACEEERASEPWAMTPLRSAATQATRRGLFLQTRSFDPPDRRTQREPRPAKARPDSRQYVQLESDALEAKKSRNALACSMSLSSSSPVPTTTLSLALGG